MSSVLIITEMRNKAASWLIRHESRSQTAVPVSLCKRCLSRSPCTLSLVSVTQTKTASSTPKSDPLITMELGLKKYAKVFSAPSHRLPDDYSLLGPYARRDHML